MKTAFLIAALFATFVLGVGCTSKSGDNTSYKDSVKKSLEQADLTDVSVSEDKEKNTVTLGGTVHSESAKKKAGDVAAATVGGRTVVNEISVRPVGAESEAKSAASNIDDGIESNYKAALLTNGLDKQHISFDAKNAVLTLKGNVKTTSELQEAQKLASNIPNVQQVVNQIEVER